MRNNREVRVNTDSKAMQYSSKEPANVQREKTDSEWSDI